MNELPNNITVKIKKSDFDLIVTKSDDRLITNDPITIKNQIQEIHTIDDLGLNVTNRVDGSLVTWNGNKNSYDVRPFNTYAAFSWSNTHAFNSNVIFKSVIFANNSPGLAGQVLTSNGQGIYWANISSHSFDSSFIVNNNIVSVNSAYIATLPSNNSSYLGGKVEANLNVNSAAYSIAATFAYSANNTSYLNGKTEGGLNVNSAATSLTSNNSSYLSGKTEINLNVNSAIYSTNSVFALISNNSSYAFGKSEADLNVSSAQSSNNSAYLNGKTEGGLNVNSATSALSANNSSYLSGKTETTLNVNSALTSNNTSYLNGKTEINLNVNSSVYSTNSAFTLVANNSVYLNGKTETHFSNATNISDGTLSEARLPYRMSQNVTSSSDVQFRNIILTGDLSVGGSITTITANNLAITDNMIYLNNGVDVIITSISGNGSVVTFTANNNFITGWDVVVTGVNPTSYNGTYINILFANATHFQVSNSNIATYVSGGSVRGKSDLNPDIGFAAGYNDGTYHHTGFFRDHTNGTWKVFDNYDPEPDASIYIDQANSSFRLANFMANTIFVGNNSVFGTITTTNFSGTSNNVTYAFGKLEGDINANSATYLGGFTSSYFAANSSLANYYLATNPSGYITSAGTANNATYAFGKIEANLNVNSAVYSTNSLFAFTANNTVNLNGQPASYYSNASNINTGTLPRSQSPLLTTRSVTSNTIISSNDNIIIASGSLVIQLPPANTMPGVPIQIKNINNSDVTILPNGSELIDGYSNMIIQFKNSSISIISNNADWFIF